MLLRASLFLTIVAGLSSAARAQQFITIDFPGGAYTNPWGINDSGLIVGYYQFVSNNVNGFLYNGGNFSTIDAPGGTSGTIATGIDNGGQIVGTYFDVSGAAHGFLDNGGSFSTIDVPDTFATYAFGLNQSGEIVGAYDQQSGSEDQGFLDNGGSFSTIDVPGAVMTDPYAINSGGQILGTYFPASGIAQGFLDNGGSFSTISDPSGPNGTFAMGVNNGGEVVGYYYDAGGIAHGFVEVGGLFSTLDVPGGIGTFPYGINNAGQIVGYYYDSSGYEHGFLYIPSILATFSVLHTFSGGQDGGYPYAGVTVDGTATLYGTASAGGPHGGGVVFKLSHRGSGWTLSPLYELTGGSDGGTPYGGITIGPNGAPYGTTFTGGSEEEGTVFELTPPATVCKSVTCYWNETTLYFFSGLDGTRPAYENLIFDRSGNIYGTAYEGGMYGGGVAFELTPSGGGWTESVLHNFGNGTDGLYPDAGLVFDTAGNLYSTTLNGGTGDECGNNCGTVYQLVPSGGGWTENVLVDFNSQNGSYPWDALFIDSSGNLYGTTSTGGQNEGGLVFELSPSGGGWSYSPLYSFSACNSHGGVTMDAAGNLYGVCYGGGANGDGWVFELPPNCNQTCTPTDLHDFGGSDGENPFGTPALDASGNLYGTTLYGGSNNVGVVWEIAGVGARHKN